MSQSIDDPSAQASDGQPLGQDDQQLISEVSEQAFADVMGATLDPLTMQRYLAKQHYLQMIDSEGMLEGMPEKITQETAESGWTIYHFDDMAMSTSAGRFIYSDGAMVEGRADDGVECLLKLASKSNMAQTLYAWLGRPLTLTVQSQESEGAVTIDGLSWEGALNDEEVQTFEFTPEQAGCFAIHYPLDNFVVSSWVKAPEPLPKTGTLYHQADVTAQRMVQAAHELGWKAFTLAMVQCA